MRRTIKQLADLLEVSKTAVRNYMTEEFRAKYTEKDCKGVILISEEGCKEIAESLGKIENNRKESAETALLTIPRSVWELMEDQIRVKDEQIRTLTSALEATSASLQAAQALHAGTMQQSLAEPSNSLKKPFFERIKSKFSEMLDD